MRYKPERALTLSDINTSRPIYITVEMRYKPERALTLTDAELKGQSSSAVEMRYKPRVRYWCLLPANKRVVRKASSQKSTRGFAPQKLR